ncbi:hypothetical protein CBL_09779 [Carabus blaptoides fortunei]
MREFAMAAEAALSYYEPFMAYAHTRYNALIPMEHPQIVQKFTNIPLQVGSITGNHLVQRYFGLRSALGNASASYCEALAAVARSFRSMPDKTFQQPVINRKWNIPLKRRYGLESGADEKTEAYDSGFIRSF